MRETIEVSASGVDRGTFDAHTHDYRKITSVGVDGVGAYTSPAREDIVDDSEVAVTDSNKCNAVGVTVSTEPTGAPN